MTTPSDAIETPTSPHFVPGLSLTREQVEQRRSRLGASEMAVVAGLSKYQSPLGLWAEKRGLVPPSFDGNEFTEWGTRLEDVIRLKYAQSNNVGVERVETIIAPNGWRSASPDGKVYALDEVDRIQKDDGREIPIEPLRPTPPWLRGLEIKCRGDFNANDFGDPGTDQIPDEVAIQCHSTMSVLRTRGIIVDRWDVATLIGGNRYRSFVILYDAQIDADLTEMAETFWTKHVLGGVEPPADGSAGTTEYLQKRFRSYTETMIEATPEQDDMLRELQNIRRQKTEIEALENGAKNRLMAIIGENTGIQGPSGKITWKAPNGSIVSWKSVAEAMNAPADLIAQHSTPMSRRFLPTFPKK